MDDIDFFAVRLPRDFPLADVEAIGARLTASGALVPGYIPSVHGMLSVLALRWAHDIDQVETRLLIDRNLASRMARLARDGVREALSGPIALAADLMAFAQAMDVQIEPSIAFHELAHCEGNAIALDELAWFRAADHGQAQAWIDLAQGRIEHLPIAAPKAELPRDLAFPLHRWRRNYVVALKIAELELADMPPLARALALFQWMVDDFYLAGPAAIFATMYFAPRAAKRRLIKQLRSADRERAIAGVKNAAWDITHLSHFVRECKRADSEGIFFIFATADRGLAEIAPILMIDADEADYADLLAARLAAWWPACDAATIAQTLFGHILRVETDTGSSPVVRSNDPIAAMIMAGEAHLRAWVSASGA